MNTPTNFDTEVDNRIKRDAGEWFSKRRGDHASASVEQGFREWLTKNPMHELVYQQLELSWEMSRDLLEDDDIKRELELAKAAAGLTGEDVLSEESQARRVFPLRWLAQCAAVVVIVMGTLVAKDYQAYERYETRVGEQRLVRLEDGSTAMLNTNTVLKVRIGSDKRSLVLSQGEAYFKVAKDKSRPFEVMADRHIVRAVGTEFNVNLHTEEVDVEVAEGIVEIEAETKGQPDPQVIARLSLGQAMSLEYGSVNGDALPAVEKANLERITAWQVRQIYFDADTLGDAIEEYNRYTEIKFTLLDNDLAQQRISGVFNLGDRKSFAFALEQLLGVKVIKKSGEYFVVKAAEPKFG